MTVDPLSVKCPRCGYDEGRYCRDRQGEIVQQNYHQARVARAWHHACMQAAARAAPEPVEVQVQGRLWEG